MGIFDSFRDAIRAGDGTREGDPEAPVGVESAKHVARDSEVTEADHEAPEGLRQHVASDGLMAEGVHGSQPTGGKHARRD